MLIYDNLSMISFLPRRLEMAERKWHSAREQPELRTMIAEPKLSRTERLKLNNKFIKNKIQ